VTLLGALRRLPPLETGILVLAVAILAGLGFARQATPQSSPTLDSFSSFDAASGGYRALYTLLEREGIRVERFEQRPAFLDAGTDTLVYVEPFAFDPRQNVPSRGDVAALEAWVRGGGRLLYIGHDDVAAKQGILKLPASRDVAHAGARPFVARALADAGVTRVPASGTRRWTRGKHPFAELLGDAAGPIVVTYPFGRGRVTAAIDETQFRNDAIASGDRARLAYALARPGRPGGLVAFDEFVHGYALPSRWWTLVPRPFAIALCFALATILIALAGAAARFGPPIVPVERRDRSSADFIDALSSLLERGFAEREALAAATASATRALARSLALPDAAPASEFAAAIEGPQTRERYRTLVAFARDEHPGRADFVRGIALAQELRKEFAAHGRPRN
jgi:hypothetical protein